MTKLLTLSQVEIQNIARAVHPLLEGVLKVLQGGLPSLGKKR